jgi:hypothetical protein
MPHFPREGKEEEEEEEDDDLMFETEKEREEREMAERRARREKMLAQLSGAGVNMRGAGKGGSGGESAIPPSPLVLSPAVSTSSLPFLLQEKEEKGYAAAAAATAAVTGAATVAATAAATVAAAATAIAPPAGKKKGKETEKEKEEAMRKFLAETRRQVEDALGGAGELMMEDVEDEEGRNEGIDGGDEVMKHEEEEEEKEEGVDAAAAAVGGGADELDIFSAEGATRTLLGWTAGWVHSPPPFPLCPLRFAY